MKSERVFQLEWLAFKNALRLHYDSIFLYRRRSYPSAFFVSVLAAEEYGKMNIFEFLYDHVGETDAEFVRDVITDIYSHGKKQHQFRQDVWSFLYDSSRMIKLPPDNLETMKQKSIYVGLPRHKGKINVKGRTIAPFTVQARHARKQITLLNDLMLDRVLGVRKGNYSWDVLEVVGFSKKQFSEKLITSWQYSSPIAVKKFIKQYGLTKRRAIA